MRLCFVIWAFIVILTESFVLPNSFNIMLNEDAWYSVDETVDDEDFEMINREQIRGLVVEDKNNIALYDLNKIASKEYVKTSRKPIDLYNLDEMDFVSYSGKMMILSTTTTRPIPLTTTTHKIRKRRGTTRKYFYDYDKFLKEYYEETVYEEENNRTYIPQPVESQSISQILRKVISADSPSDAGVSGSIISTVRHTICLNANNCTHQEVLLRIMGISKLLFLAYVAVALPLFCMKGWCCCCLNCKVFKPRLTIREAKQYLIENPPGILKTGKGTTLYEPTDEERDCYAQFDHLVRII